MRRTLLKSKIHRATVTEADLHYEGSITIDRDLMDAADLQRFEKIEIYNVTNGERFATYVIPGERGKGEIVINGAAAHKASPGDLVILCCYADYDEAELEGHRARLVYVDGGNRIVRTVPEGLAKVS
ncbi:MAG: aspartate 1-decarboxylase [Thermoanaerobaculia bacterium]